MTLLDKPKASQYPRIYIRNLGRNHENIGYCNFSVNMLGKGHGGLYKAPTRKEEGERLRGERDQIKFIDLLLKGGRL